MTNKAGEQPTIKQADILATEFDRIRLAFDSVNRDHDKAAARHDAIVMAFKKKVRQALAGDDHGHR